MKDLIVPAYFVWPTPPINPGIQPLWDNLTQTFAVGMCPKRFLQHTAAMQAFFDSLSSTRQPDFVILADSINTLYRSQGRARIEDIALDSGISRRHLERQFNTALGLSPKRLARLIRFEAVRDHLLTDPLYRLTALPYEFGYTDQAHFIRDFKGLAALTPGEFVDLVLNGDAVEDEDYCKVTRACPLFTEGAGND